MKHRLVVPILISVFVAAAGQPAAAGKGLVCEHVQDGMFAVDGMIDDWQGLSATTFGSSGVDAALAARCAYDSGKLYVSLDITDERIVRTSAARAGAEDHLQLRLAVGDARPLSITFFPSSESVRAKSNAPKFVELEDSLQENGFSIELAVPLDKLANFSSSVPYLRGRLAFHDQDAARGQSLLAVDGKLHFSDHVATYQAFMRTARLNNRDIKLDCLADVDPGQGPERVLWGKQVIGILGDGFNFMNLPVASPEDIVSVQLVDFDGSGRSTLVTELRQHGNGGSRNIVVVWAVQGDGSFQQVLAVESQKLSGERKIVNRWSLVPRGAHRLPTTGKARKPRIEPGFDLLFEVGEVVGWDSSSFREAPSPDAKPILTPWGPQQSAVYFLEGTVGYGGDAAIALQRTSRR